MSTESKRGWRENPDRSTESERKRARARRDGYWLRRDEWADAAGVGTLEQLYVPVVGLVLPLRAKRQANPSDS